MLEHAGFRRLIPLAGFAGGAKGVYKTASGAIVTVTDALPALLKSLIIGITPVQDLHGYDAPWPAGGGKNLFDKDTAVDGYINNLGTAISPPDAENMTSDFIPVTAGSQYTYTQWPTDVGAGYWIGCGFYAEKDMSTVIGGRQTTNALVGMFTAPEGANYMRIGSRFLKNGKAQLEKGAVSTAYAPYSNICPISGWTGANVSRTGKNLLNKADATINRNNAVWGGTQSSFSGDFILKAGTYTLSCSHNVGGFYVTDISGANVHVAYNRASTTFANPKTQAVKINFYISDVTQADMQGFDYQLEIGSEATAYEPYSGTLYPISWQSEAGTVYGGTLDVTSGVLYETRKSITLNGNNLIRSADNAFYSSAVDNIKYSTGTNLITAISDKFKSGALQGEDCVFVNTQGRIRINTSNAYSSVANLISAVGEIAVVYELATPVTYQLTPQEVALLRGTNNVWADTGDTEITYYATRS